MHILVSIYLSIFHLSIYPRLSMYSSEIYVSMYLCFYVSMSVVVAFSERYCRSRRVWGCGSFKSIYLSIYPSIYQYLHVNILLYLTIYLSISMNLYVYIYINIYMYTYLHLPICLSIYLLSIYLSLSCYAFSRNLCMYVSMSVVAAFCERYCRSR